MSEDAEINAGPVTLFISGGDNFDNGGNETQEFIIDCWPEKFRVHVWRENGNRFFKIGDIFDYFCSEPAKLNGEGTFIDIIRTPQGSIEILGWIMELLPVWTEIKLAIDAIRLILEDHDRIHDPFYLDRIYNVWVYDPEKFELGVFRKMVESKISKDAVRLIPELSQKCWENFSEKETKNLYEWIYH